MTLPTTTATLRTYTVGTGDWGIRAITGVDDYTVKSVDYARHFANGSVAVADHADAQLIVIDVQTDPSIVTYSAAQTALTALRTAWAPSSGDLTLGVVLGTLSTSFTGRPRGFVVDRSAMTFGVIRAQLSFLNLN